MSLRTVDERDTEIAVLKLRVSAVGRDRRAAALSDLAAQDAALIWPTAKAEENSAPTLRFPLEHYPPKMTLTACPVGLFMYGDELCLKTEYRTARGAIEAYIASTGEFFWGAQPQTVESQLGQIVRPIEVVERADESSEQVGWRPIETAPWEPAPGEQWMLLWNGHWRGVGRRWAGYDGDPGFCDETTEFITPEPTHWLPLPTPPKA